MSSTTALPDKTWLTTREVAQYLGLSPGGLRGLVCKGEGPPASRITQARIMFHRDDLTAWEEQIRSEAAEDKKNRQHYATLRGLQPSPLLKGLIS